MRRKRAAILACLVAAGTIAACSGSGSDPTSNVSTTTPEASTFDSSSEPDAVATGADASADAASDAPGAPVYPNCTRVVDGDGDQAWGACNATKTCVYPCGGCPGASNYCFLDSAAQCVDSCAACGPAKTTACDGSCTDLTRDLANCGSCNHACQAIPHAGGATCGAGHCCPQIDRGAGVMQPSTWMPACSLCCIGGCSDSGTGCVPEGTN